MIGFYLVLASLFGISIFLMRSKQLQIILLCGFVALQWTICLHAILQFRNTELLYFTYDSLGLLLLITLSVICIPAAFYSHIYLQNQPATLRMRGVFYAAFIFLITSITAGYLSNHIAVTWIFTELTTLCASALIYHHRTKLALEGTWKYVFICAISITFVFIGILFLSLSMEHAGVNDLSFSALLRNKSQLNPYWLRLAFVFIFTGFTAKLGLVPMFTAGIDAKDKAPAPAGALLSTVLTNLGFVGIFRFYVVMANTSLQHWAAMVVGISAILSILVATVYMVKVNNIKRMMAYSGIEHAGLIMLGIAAGGIGYYAAILHLVLHAFVKSSMFFQFTQIYKIYKSKSIYDVGNYFKYNFIGAIALLLGFISITAMPPSGLFVSEFLIFKSLVEAKQWSILIFVLILITVIIWSFGRKIFKILFIPPLGFNDSNIEPIHAWQSIPQFLLLGAAVYLGLHPPDGFVFLINDSIKDLVHTSLL